MKSILTILLVALLGGRLTPAATDGGPATVCTNDPLPADTITNDEGCKNDRLSAVLRDTIPTHVKMRIIDDNAVKVKKYDTFKEKMKEEPFATDLLKDILFH